MPKAIRNTSDKVRRELSALREDLDATAEKIRDKTNDRVKMDGAAHDLINAVKNGLDRIEVTAENGATGIRDGFRRGGKAIRNATGRVTGAVDETLHERPVAAIALMAGLGFLAGRVLHGKRHREQEEPPDTRH